MFLFALKMVRKRVVRELDSSSSGGSETDSSEDVQCSQLPYMDYDSCEYLSNSQLVGEVSYFNLCFFYLFCL